MGPVSILEAVEAAIREQGEGPSLVVDLEVPSSRADDVDFRRFRLVVRLTPDARDAVWREVWDLWDDERAEEVSLAGYGLRSTHQAVVIGLLIVPASLRFTGIGSAVLRRVEAWARDRGATWSVLTAGNPDTGGGPPSPIPFYARLGYVEVSRYDFVAVMIRRLSGGVLRASSTVPDPTRQRVPEVPPAAFAQLAAVAQAESIAPVAFARMAERARQLGLPFFVTQAGSRVHKGMVLVLRSQDPAWDYSILDIARFVDPWPPLAGWVAARRQAQPAPMGAPSLRLIPPGHPEYRLGGYNPDPRVTGGRARLGRAAWPDRPPDTHAFWTEYDPEIEYFEVGQYQDRIQRAVSAVGDLWRSLSTAGRQARLPTVAIEESLEGMDFGGAARRTLARAAGLPVLGLGGSRAVFHLAPRRVLKVTWDEKGFGACNLREWSRWQAASPELRAYLVPCVDADAVRGSWLIQVLAEPLRPSGPQGAGLDGAARPLFLQRERELVRLSQVQDDPIDDADTPRNWGWYRGRMCMMDYAGVDCVYDVDYPPRTRPESIEYVAPVTLPI